MERSLELLSGSYFEAINNNVIITSVCTPQVLAWPVCILPIQETGSVQTKNFKFYIVTDIKVGSTSDFGFMTFI